jgi:hypothetical protein
MTQGSGEIHVDLLQEYVNILEEFEKRYGMLFEVQIRTQLKIRQVTGLRDGVRTPPFYPTNFKFLIYEADISSHERRR